jgi:nucleotide-binding universal stress UspA family protein/nitroimidazol reductase NimA-like FMN-containing flavoprotein (pyridoxamine 5'-phosphate oxidase superfamily)
MFGSIVVALDLEPGGDRALPIARGLARAGGLPVVLLTVSSPNISEARDIYELRRRAEANGWPVDGCTVAHDNDVARAIVDDVERGDRALLVMATSAKGSLAAQFLGGVTEDVLSLIDRPLLLVGPRVPSDCEPAHPTPVVCIERSDVAEAAVPAIASWSRTFGGRDPLLAELPDGSADRGASPTSAQVESFESLLSAEGIDAGRTTVHGDHFDSWLDDLAEQVADAVVVSTSARWSDKRSRGRSTTRRLVQRSTRPVLVVPARYAPWQAPSVPSSPPPEMPLDAVEELSAATCWEVLTSSRVGRLAVCSSGSPRIFPINFVVDEHTIVFRTAPGTKLAGVRNSSVAFEVDDYDADTGQATSVIIAGTATEITDADEWDRALELPLFPWHVAPKGHFVRVTPDTVSGRRFRAAYAGGTGTSPKRP